MTLTREVEGLAARCQRATAHDMRIQSAVVTVVRVCGQVEELPLGGVGVGRGGVPIDVLIEV